MDMRSKWSGHAVLLFAMAVQGVTPDDRALASSRLLTLVANSTFGVRPSADTPSPSPFRVPDDREDEIPGELCSIAATDATSRVRLDDSLRIILQVIAVERPGVHARLATRLRPPIDALAPGPGLICSLCRFLC